MSAGHVDDARLRAATFAFLTAQMELQGDVLPWNVLRDQFEFDGTRVPLVSMQGIFKPAVLAEMPLTIRTTPPDSRRPMPYDDAIGRDGLLVYRYRQAKPKHPENVGVRLAMQRQVPLVYLYGIVEGQYMPVFPVFVVGDDPVACSFTIAIDDLQLASIRPVETNVVAEARRQYVTVLTTRRMHQASFRWRVLQAYANRCAICRLRHTELLEAAHILPDGHPLGEPIVPNGVALCKLHHAAFDRYILGIRPDCVIEIRRDILEEEDGPMLKFGLQAIDGSKLQLPKANAQRPRPAFLEERYELFKRAV